MKICTTNFRKIFSFLRKLFLFIDLDSHYIIKVFGIQVTLKHRCRFKYKKAVNYGISNETRIPRVIISLTSHPARINMVHLTINTLLQQTMKPDLVILWLAKEQFPKGIDELPGELLDLQKLGLSIRWCEDLKSYKKLIPVLKEFPEDIIVTVDDDLYYEEDMLESLYQSYLSHPDEIHVHRIAKVVKVKDKLSALQSRKFYYDNLSGSSYCYQLMGGSGCLYPPHSLYKDVFDIAKIKSLAPTQDDIYFWAMAVLNGTKVRIVKGFKSQLYYVENTQQHGLCKINNNTGYGMSPGQVYENICKTYPEILSRCEEI